MMMRHTNVAGGVVIGPSGDVLVVEQRGGHWSLPKGHVEGGEDAVVAARREIAEESGVTDLAFVRKLGSYGRYRMSLGGGDSPDEFKDIVVFLFTTDQRMLSPRDPHNPTARWVPLDAVVAALTHAKDKEFFRSMLSDIRQR